MTDSFDSSDGILLEQQNQYIELPTPDFEKNYSHIKSLIFDGFIPFKASFFGLNCVFKALNPSEFRFLELIESDPVKRLPYYFLYSLAYVDGICVLNQRHNLHEKIVELWESLPIPASNFIISVIQAIQNAQFACYENLEGYLYENESRFTWFVQGENAVKNRMIKGYETIGLNTAQESWIAFNKREDIREEQERLFEHSKFIVSGMVGGKEIKKIEAAEKNRQNDERRRRQDVRLKNKKLDKNIFTQINTAEDLVAELNRQIKGEKDIHDRIIEQHEINLQNMKEKRLRDLESAVDEAKQIEDGSRIVTQEEMEKTIKNNNNPGFDNNLESMNYLIDKVNNTSKKSSQKIGDMKPKSIFDSEIQKELSKINKN